MTQIIPNPPHPDRLACRHCHCEVWIQRGSEPRVALGPLDYPGGGWFREMGLDEAPVHAPADCECRCHEPHKRMMRFPY